MAQPEGKTHSQIQIPKKQTYGFIEKFCGAYQKKVSFWEKQLSQYEKKNKTVVLWGAGSKGITFLNTLNISIQRIKYIVDLNSHKQGKYVTGMGQKIITPDALKNICPHVVIIMNPIYQDEIQKTLQDLHIDAEVLVA